MTLESKGFYSYSVAGFSNLPIGIVFNNGDGSSQSVDLFASADLCWEDAGLSDVKYLATEVICLVPRFKNNREQPLYLSNRKPWEIHYKSLSERTNYSLHSSR